MRREHLQPPDVNRGHELVGIARCAVRAAFSGATVPPATARAGTSQRDVPTRVRFMGREPRKKSQNLKPSPGIDVGNHHPALSRTTVHALLKQLVGGGFARTLAASTTLV